VGFILLCRLQLDKVAPAAGCEGVMMGLLSLATAPWLLLLMMWQAANKEGHTPLGLAGDLAPALQQARSSGCVLPNGHHSGNGCSNGHMEE
jgi:hypothetical protein